MENTLGIIGTITGVLGLALAVFIAIMQAKEQKRNAQERAEEKERHAQELEKHAQELEIQKQEKARSDRLMFLADRIFDSSIPGELRQPFYEEYISMKGNGTAVRFWLLEGEREKKTQQPA
jgi:regulator of protease activity HflC (stomatin/prohibitin superfamily)